MTLQVELSPEHHERLIEMAGRLGVEPEELARAALIDMVNGPDGEFTRVVRRVLAKNADLYRRLAQ